jgi:hypothetical protein
MKYLNVGISFEIIIVRFLKRTFTLVGAAHSKDDPRHKVFVLTVEKRKILTDFLEQNGIARRLCEIKERNEKATL